jgi:Tol biopolymer transport system component
VTSHPATDASPVWSRDGARLVFRSNRLGLHDLYVTPGDRDDGRLLLTTREAKYATDWAPDNSSVVFHTRTAMGWDILAVPVSQKGAPRTLVRSRFNEFQGTLSPNGRWLAFSSDESSVPQVYVRAMVAGSGWRLVSTKGGSHPAWRRDGRELYFLSADGTLMAVPVTNPESLEMGVPVPLFTIGPHPVVAPYASTAYAVGETGERFLVPRSEQVPSAPLTIVVDWPALVVEARFP